MTTPSSDDVRVVCRIRGGGEFSPDAADGPPPPPSEGSVAVGNDGKSVVIAAALGVGDGVGYRFDAVIDDRRQTTTPPSKRPLGARPTGDEPTGQDVSGCASSYVSSQAAVFDQHVRPIIDAVLRKVVNATVMAYGQTGSGKTFTLEGAAMNSAPHVNGWTSDVVGRGAPGERRDEEVPTREAFVKGASLLRSQEEETSTDGFETVDVVESSSHWDAEPLNALVIRSPDVVAGPSVPNEAGMVVRGLFHIFEHLARLENATSNGAAGGHHLPDSTALMHSAVRIRMLEVYMENVRDLLTFSPIRNGDNVSWNPSLRIRAARQLDGSLRFVPENARDVTCRTFQEAKATYIMGCRARSTRSHTLNATSSRSHCLLFVSICKAASSSSSRVSDVSAATTAADDAEICFADLAGSEKTDTLTFTGAPAWQVKPPSSRNGSRPPTVASGGRPRTTGDGESRRGLRRSPSSEERMMQLCGAAESSAINTSLLALRKVITALAASTSSSNAANHRRTRHHVPYRESRLTMLLMHAIGGRALTLIFACVNAEYPNESMGTCRFAVLSKSIPCAAAVLEAPWQTSIRQLRARVAELEMELAAAREALEPPLSRPEGMAVAAESDQPLLPPGNVTAPAGGGVMRRSDDNGEEDHNALLSSVVASVARLRSVLEHNARLRSAFDALAEKYRGERELNATLTEENAALRDALLLAAKRSTPPPLAASASIAERMCWLDTTTTAEEAVAKARPVSLGVDSPSIPGRLVESSCTPAARKMPLDPFMVGGVQPCAHHRKAAVLLTPPSQSSVGAHHRAASIASSPSSAAPIRCATAFTALLRRWRKDHLQGRHHRLIMGAGRRRDVPPTEGAKQLVTESLPVSSNGRPQEVTSPRSELCLVATADVEGGGGGGSTVPSGHTRNRSSVSMTRWSFWDALHSAPTC